MRSTVPLPGNPWPHDMILTVADDPHALIELLWIREAWGLKPAGDELPPLLSDTPSQAQGHVDPARRIAWEDAWPALWEACLHHEGQIQDAALFEQLGAAASGSAERAALLNQLVGPNWRDTFGDPRRYSEALEQFRRELA